LQLKAGAKVELPFWLTKVLLSKKLVSISLPKNYSQKYLSTLKADPVTISLPSHFYELGLEFANILQNEELKETLVGIFSERYRKILDQSHNRKHADITQFVSKLTNMEKNLFYFGLHATEKFRDWKNKKLSKLSSSDLCSPAKKRKFDEVLQNSIQ
jgi:hypothetical protein